MRFSLTLCLAVSMGVAVFARPEGESSPVSNPASAAEDAGESKIVEEAPAEEEAARPKRWYFYPGDPVGYGFGSPFGDMIPSPSVGTPIVAPGISGRTRYAPRTASLNELVDHTRRQEQQWQNQQWQRQQYFQQQNFQQNLPDVIDTAGYHNNNFNNRHPFNQGFNNNNRQFNQGFNSGFDNRPDVIDTQSTESRTRGFPTMVPSASNFNPNFDYQPQWQGYNPNFHPQQPYF